MKRHLKRLKSSFSEFGDFQKVDIRVRYADVDQMGVVYHANYFAYFESGRAELIRHIWKPYSQLEKEGMILPIIEAGCRYRQGARYDDLLTVCTRVANFSGARLRFEYTIFNNTDNPPLVEGFTVHCIIDRAGRPLRLPADLLVALRRQFPGRTIRD